MGIPDHLICLLKNLYGGQETTIRTGHEQQTGAKLERSTSRLYIVTCLFNLYEEYIMQNNALYDAQAGIKIARRNINSLKYADETTLMAESEEELKSLLIKMKEESKKAG